MNSKVKREPLLCDLYLASAPKSKKGLAYTDEGWRIVKGLGDQLLEAKRFVLDDTASMYLGEMIRDVPEAVAYGQQFAIPPFKKMWIEFPYEPFFKVVAEGSLDSTSDNRIGYLFLGNRIYVLAQGRASGSAAVMPLCYLLNEPFDLKTELKFCGDVGVSRLSIDHFFWGRSSQVLEPEASRSLRANHSIKCFFDQSSSINSVKAFRTISSGSAGDLRNALALLILLNRTSKLQIHYDIGPDRVVLKGKVRALLRHSKVVLKMNPVPRFKRIAKGPVSFWKRLHDVRGHFCLNREAREAESAGHLHDWVEQGYRKWRCMGCPGLKWWRKEHQRGHKEKGTVVTDYEVIE
jgi:hypothetical protein